MMKIFNKVRTKISLSQFFILSIIFIICIIVASYSSVYRSTISTRITDIFYGNSKDKSSYVVNRIDAEFSFTESHVLTIANTIKQIGLEDEEKINVFLQNINQTNSRNFSYEIINLDKEIIYSYPQNENIIGVNKSNIDYFDSLLQVDDVMWVKPHIEPHYDEPALAVVTKADDFYLEVFLPMSYLDQLYTEIFEEQEDTNFLITNEYGIIVYDSGSNNDDISFQLNNFMELIVLVDSDDSTNIYEINGEESIVSASKIGQYNWFIFTYEPSANIKTLNNSIYLMFSLLISILFVVFLGVFTTVFGILKIHLSRFQKSFELVSEGKLDDVLDTNNFKDINKLTTSLNVMVGNLKDSRQRLEEYLHIDDITGFYTRNYLLSKYKEVLLSKDSTEGYMIYFDIKRFGVINESYGFDIGDKVLRAFSTKLKSTDFEFVGVFRYESDEFIIIAENANESQVSSLVDEIVSVFENVLVVEKIIVTLSFNYGVSKYDINNREIEETVNHCKMALNVAKKDQLNDVVFYEDLDGRNLERQLQIELSLDNALENKEFKIVFQPMVEMKSESIRGFEALSRWESKKLGHVTPNEFIPLLEKSHRIHKLDMYVINEAVKMTKSLSKKYNKDFVLSCNVSTETLLNDSFVGYIIDTLNKFKYEGRFLELEITESAIITDFDKVKRIISTLRGYGVRFSEDDFGDGFSSLNYLTRLDIDTLKVSKNLVDAIGDGFNNAILFNSILTLANDLGLETVIEGVENKKTIDIVRQYNCNYIQGYYYYKPLSFSALSKVLEEAKNDD